jgi:hypothetical protein
VTRARRGRGERGFVLVGVVMFVIALTIIVMSLYSLSSYEAQFFHHSMDGEQAYHAAMGGLERAKLVLAVTSRLERVGQNLPLDCVVSALATQQKPGGAATAGDVDWTPTEPITLRVTADVHGERRTVEARFTPAQARSYYSQAVTACAEIHVDDKNAPEPQIKTLRTGTVHFGSSYVWDASSPTDTLQWLAQVGIRPNVPIVTTPLPAPDLASYFAAHPATLATPAGYVLHPNFQRYTLDNPTADPMYFAAPAGNDPNAYYREPNGNPEVWVRGIVVWEFPGGVRFDDNVQLKSLGTGGCLVIVAGPCGSPPPSPEDDADAAIRLFGGMSQSNPSNPVSVILVSNGRVYVQHMNEPTGWTDLEDVAIYSSRVWLTGPETSSGRTMVLQHLATGPLDQVYLQTLAEAGALPNVNAGLGRSFAFVPGTWRSVRP